MWHGCDDFLVILEVTEDKWHQIWKMKKGRGKPGKEVVLQYCQNQIKFWHEIDFHNKCVTNNTPHQDLDDYLWTYLRDVPDSGSLNNVPDHKLPDGLILGASLGAVHTPDELHVAASGLVASTIATLERHFKLLKVKDKSWLAIYKCNHNLFTF